MFAVFNVLPGTAGNRLYCTATLIGSRTLLTAAHCADNLGPGAQAIKVASALDVSAGTAGLSLFDVVERRVHPEWDPRAIGAAFHGRDFALLLLDRAPGITPKPLGFRRLDESALGAPLRLVGYGDTENGGEGRRLSTGVILSRLPGARMLYDQSDGHGSCGGDSGGPTFLLEDGEERLAGVTSLGDADCVLRGYSARLDRQIAFVHAWMLEKETPTCARDSLCAPGCDDRDCVCALDGLCGGCPDPRDDPDCPFDRPSGESCTWDGDCPDGLCLNDAGGFYCAPTCPIDDGPCSSGSCDEAQGLCVREAPAPPEKRGCDAATPWWWIIAAAARARAGRRSSRTRDPRATAAPR